MMPQWLQTVAAALIPALIVAVLTAYVTVRLALKRFRAERWWDRKAEAYTQIVESLYQLKAYSDAMIPECLDGRECTPEERKRLDDEYSTARRELSKTTAIGAFTICDEAAKVLDELSKRPRLDWERNSLLGVLEEDTKAYGDALEKIREIAKRDLGVS